MFTYSHKRKGIAPIRIEEDTSMPLVVCTIFFILLFACEAIYYSDKAMNAKAQLSRYYEVEHPRYNRSDSYLDSSWV